MKINLQKISEIEIDYKDNPIVLNTLQTMVDIIVSDIYPADNSLPGGLSVAKAVATDTLIAIGVLED